MQIEDLYQYTIRIADDSFVIGHRLSEWCGHGPILEEDIALTNFALDFIGQANILYDYCSELKNRNVSADDIAFLRKENEYKNLILLEIPNGDFAQTIIKQYFFDTFRKYFFEYLKLSKNDFLSSFSQKALLETKYHHKHSSEWILRLGLGTDVSHKKMCDALPTVNKFTHELFFMDSLDFNLIQDGIAVDLNKIKDLWENEVSNHLREANLEFSHINNSFFSGRNGRHTEYFGYILTDVQYMQRTYPNSKW